MLTTRLRAAAVVAASLVCVAFADPQPAPCRATISDTSSTPIRWVEPADAAARRELSRWCGTVGPAVIRSAPARTPAPPANRFVVVSWNVNVGGGAVRVVIDRLRNGSFTDGRPVTQFALLLQEEYRAGNAVPPSVPRGFPTPSRIAPIVKGLQREDVETVANDEGLALFYVPSMRNGGVVRPIEDRGNAILSTLPLGDLTAIELPVEHQRRVVVAATVHSGSWTLRLVDVHLDTALALAHGGPFAARRRQAQTIVSAVSSTTPTLIAGDLNTWRGNGEGAVAVFQNAFPQVAQRATTTWMGFGFRADLDHVFARGVGSIDVRRLSDRFGSDHFPLLATISF